LFDEHTLASFPSFVDAEPFAAQIGMRSRDDLHATGTASASFPETCRAHPLGC
jgi:hypothetical protein